jgi:hypothetical protein
MKKGMFLMMIFGFSVFLALSLVSATCSLDAELVNQDPYPAIPGDTVEVVFQVSGVSNPECNGATFEVVPSYPFSIEGGGDARRILEGGTYTKDYKREWVIPYSLVVSEDTIDGKRKLEVRYKAGTSESSGIFFSEEFNISIEDVRADFELSVKDYDPATKEITFEILNIGKNDVEALTIDVPEQENLTLRGSPRIIVGSLDSNEEDTFRVKADPERGILNLNVTYTDQTNERRTLQKSVFFEPKYFGSVEKKSASPWIYVFIAAAAIGIFFWVRQRKKRKERMKKKHHHI